MKQPYDILQEQFNELRKLHEALKLKLAELKRQNEDLQDRLKDLIPSEERGE